VSLLKKPSIEVYCDGGLGNRIRGLLNALGWFQPDELEILWPKNNWCEASFFDVFAPDLLQFKEASFDEVKTRLCQEKILLFAHENQFGCPGERFNDIRRLRNPRKSILEANSKNKTQAIVYTSEIHPSLSLKSILRSCDFLRWNPMAQANASAFACANSLEKGEYTGFHVRLTDSGYRPEQYRKYFQPSRRFYGKSLICTDAYEEACRIAGGQPGILIRSPAAEPEKYRDELAWRENTRYADGRSFAFNVRRSLEAIQEAVVDLILLAGSRIRPSRLSSFSEVAGYLGYRHQPIAMKLHLLKRRWIQKIKFLILWWQHLRP